MSMALSFAFSTIPSTSQQFSSSLHLHLPPLGNHHRRSLISTSTSRNGYLFHRRAMESATVNIGAKPRKDVAKVTNFSSVPTPPSGGPWLSIPNIPTWAKLVLGSILVVAAPFYKKVLRIEDGVEKAAETVIEAVEKVAETAEKVASDIAHALPDNSELKEEVMEIVGIADKVDKDAEKAEEFIHKVDKVKDEVDEIKDEVNEAVEHIIEEGEKIEKETKDKEKEEADSAEEKADAINVPA